MLKPKQYGPPEPNVIDEALILSAVADADRVAQMYDDIPANPPYKLSELPQLALSFKNLYACSNLGCLDSLRELRLDNNNILKIEGLSHLVNLTWLDLSFNKIEVIEGLDTLTKLTDLSLFNNKIKEVTGLSELKLMESLSLGNNLLRSTSQLAPLRPLKTLKSLNLVGNPMCSTRDYRHFTIAFLPNLMYLDYILIEAADVQAAKELAAQTEELVEVKERDAIEASAREQQKARATALAALQAANIAAVETLLDDAMRDDPEIVKLRFLPVMQPILKELRDSVHDLTEDFKVKALAANATIVAEVDAFQSAVADLGTASAAQAVELITEYQRQYKHALKAFNGGSMQALAPLKASLDDLQSALLTSEMRCNEQVEELFEVFEAALNELRLAKLATHQAFFRGVESFEAKCHDAMHAVEDSILKTAAEDPAAFETLPDDLSMLARDKETLISTITGSHDLRVSFIISKEDELTGLENRRCAAFSKEPRLHERKRNRDRVIEIREIIATFTKEVRELEADLEEEEED